MKIPKFQSQAFQIREYPKFVGFWLILAHILLTSHYTGARGDTPAAARGVAFLSKLQRRAVTVAIARVV